MRITPYAVVAALAVPFLPAPALAGPAPGSRPPPVEQRVRLGGHVELGAAYLQVTSEERGACTSPPFTADEFERVGRDRLFNFVTTDVQGKKQSVTRMVKLDARNDKQARMVALSTYLQQVNAVERFYNVHGYTLRHGPLALRGPAHGRECHARSPALPGFFPLIRARIVDPPQATGLHVDPGSVPHTTPNGPGPGDVMLGDLTLIDVNGLPFVNLGRISLDLGAQAGRRLPGESALLRNLPLPRLMHAGCPAQCTLELGKTTFLTPEAQALLDRPDEVVYTKYTCRILTDSADNAANCDPLFKDKIGDVTRRQQWAEFIDVDFFLANHANPCAVLAKEGKDDFAKLYVASQTSAGDVDQLTGTSAADFFAGTLHYRNTGIADCVLDMGSNSLFGAQFCLRYDTANDYAPASGYHIVDSAGMVTSATLFGLDFDLMSGTATTDWRQPRTPPVVQPKITTTLAQDTHTQHYEGPGATVMFGPVPITLRSFADATLDVGKPQPEFAPPPLASGVAGEGRVGMRVGAATDVAVGMDAAVDAVVLSAGVSGKLSLLNNTLTGGIVSRITPKANELDVDKSYSLEATTLKGAVSAFVEVDLLVYTERYSVDIVSFPGTTTKEPLSSTTWGPVHAVIPGSGGTGACGT